MRAAHPVAYPALRASRRPVQRIPGLGVLVRDATLLRWVLMNTDSFTKTGPGSPSDLWTPVLGPAVLLNMEGADHLALRRKLGPLFAPAALNALPSEAASFLALHEPMYVPFAEFAQRGSVFGATLDHGQPGTFAQVRRDRRPADAGARAGYQRDAPIKPPPDGLMSK